MLDDQESLQLQGVYGESYQTEQKEFAGYEFVKVEGEEQGIFNETTPTIVYHYKKVTENPDDNDNNGNNGNNGNKGYNGNNGNNSNKGSHITNVNNKITKKQTRIKTKKHFHSLENNVK